MSKSNYGDIARRIIKKEPAVEQVGFIYSEDGSDISLRMAGDEFCGNATMCAAIHYGARHGLNKARVYVKVYSIDDLIQVDIEEISEKNWIGIVKMPRPRKIIDIKFPNGNTFPVVYFSSIAHIIVADSENDIDTRFEKEKSESLIKNWCEFLKVPAIGIMHYNINDSSIEPLVYVKSVDTLFWENSCASGTTAVGAWLSRKNDETIDLNVRQRCGLDLRVFTDKDKNIFLRGSVECI